VACASTCHSNTVDFAICFNAVSDPGVGMTHDSDVDHLSMSVMNGGHVIDVMRIVTTDVHDCSFHSF